MPAIDPDDLAADDFALIAYEPMITGGVGLQGRFGGERARRSGLAPHVQVNPERRDVAVIEYAELAGTVTDDAGQADRRRHGHGEAQGAHRAPASPTREGEYTITAVPIGKTVNGVTTLDDTGAEVSVAVANKKPGSTTLTLVKGKNQLARIELAPLLPPGQLKVVVRAAATGKPLAATIQIEPGGITATSGADGTLSIDLPPGTYKATATAPGHKPQTLDVTVDPNGVAIKNFELPQVGARAAASPSSPCCSSSPACGGKQRPRSRSWRRPTGRSSARRAADPGRRPRSAPRTTSATRRARAPAARSS